MESLHEVVELDPRMAESLRVVVDIRKAGSAPVSVQVVHIDLTCEHSGSDGTFRSSVPDGKDFVPSRPTLP